MPSPKYLQHSELNGNSLDALPVELLSAIINGFIPNISAYFAPPTYVFNTEHVYFYQLKFLASLRLIDSFWNRFITPILFSTFVSVPQEFLSMEKDIFRSYGPLIQHLVIRGRVLVRQHDPFPELELLEACLAECTNVRALTLMSASGLLLGSRKGDVRKLFRTLENRTTLRTVEFRSSRYNHADPASNYAISHVLVGIGKAVESLTTLEISDWTNIPISQQTYPCDLPSAFPSLRRLKLRSLGARTANDVQKLTSRIVRRETGYDGKIKRVVPLQELEIEAMNGDLVNLRILRKILASNHLGMGLTTLFFYCGRGHMADLQEMETLPLFIAAACPNLARFHFTPPCTAKVLERLPSKLREFGISIPATGPRWQPVLPPSTITSHEPLIQFLLLKRSTLAGFTLKVFWVRINSDGDDLLQDTCDQVGVHYEHLDVKM